jgi:DeoR family fructose operon transcriptional repressor
MFAVERHQRIVEQARFAGRVDVAALASQLAVTAETIRRDLSILEGQGLLRRVHGGALPVESLGFEPGLGARVAVMTAEKDRIALAALAEVPDGGTILLDAGTSTARLAEALPTDRPLTVLTNAPSIAMALSARANLTLLLIGGRVRGRTLAAVDEWALRLLAEVYCDVAFVGTNGISVGRGLTTPDLAEAAVKRAMIRAGRRVIVLADHTKVDNDCFAQFGNLADIDVFVTDTGLDDDRAAQLSAAGLRVVRA